MPTKTPLLTPVMDDLRTGLLVFALERFDTFFTLWLAVLLLKGRRYLLKGSIELFRGGEVEFNDIVCGDRGIYGADIMNEVN